MQTEQKHAGLPDDNGVIQMTSEQQADELITSHPLLVCFFTAPACSVCHAVKPRLIEMAKRHRSPLLMVSVDEHVAFSAQRLVFTVPTVLVLNNGREIDRESRFIDFEQLERTLTSVSADSFDKLKG